MANFSQIIKYLRAQQGLTQTDLATKLGLSRSTIGMYESGVRQPDFETLELIADYFNVDMNYLLGRSDKTTCIPHPVQAETSQKNSKDIEKILAETEATLQSQGGLMFDGEPASPEAIDSILAAMRFGMTQAAIINKKYTPKKYRKGGDNDDGKNPR